MSETDNDQAFLIELRKRQEENLQTLIVKIGPQVLRFTGQGSFRIGVDEASTTWEAGIVMPSDHYTTVCIMVHRDLEDNKREFVGCIFDEMQGLQIWGERNEYEETAQDILPRLSDPLVINEAFMRAIQLPHSGKTPQNP